MIILNFGHSLSESAIKYLSSEYKSIKEVMIPFAIDRKKSIAVEVEKIVEGRVSKRILSGSQPYLVVLPSLSIGVAYLLTYLHGRVGSFPLVVDLTRNSKFGVYEVKEILDLQSERDRARLRRKRSK